VALSQNLKLAPWFFGPFQIIQKVGSVAYKIDLPLESKIHPVFHMSCLKKKLGQQVLPFPILPPVDQNGELKPEPEAILEPRMGKIGTWPANEVLVQWCGALQENNTWELLYKLRDTCPHLVGKVF